jgi:predicted RNA binding protein YcfA (HicA-like mRNA interferase family)
MMDLDAFYLEREEPNQSCLLALRTIILNHNDNLTETRKYGMPYFCYKKKMFCYLWVDKETDFPYILMVKGKNLSHPALVAGDRARMKVLNIDPGEDIRLEIIESIFKEAIKLY